MRLEECIEVDARPSAVWEHVHDPARYVEWMRGLTRFEPVNGAGKPSEGARYSMRMKAGSAEVGGVVELVEYDACKDVAWNSISGIDQRGRIRLREREPGCTTITFRVTYQSPGGVWALIAD